MNRWSVRSPQVLALAWGIAGAVCATWAPPAVAQQHVALGAVDDNTKPIERALSRPITINVTNVSLAHAIDAIAASAGVPVQYRVRTIDAYPALVTAHLSQVPLRSALTHILRGTPLIVVPDGPARLAIVMSGNIATPPIIATGTITGRITDAKTKRPLEGVSVTIDNATRGVTTDQSGAFRLPNVNTGDHRINVRLIGYTKQVKSVTISDGQTVTLDFALEASVAALDQIVVTGTVVQTELKAVPNAITVITAKDIAQRGITHIDQLFRGDVPGLFAQNLGTQSTLGQVIMFSRGATSLGFSTEHLSDAYNQTNPIKTYVDGVELADPSYLSQIDPQSIERIEILTGPQASTIYGSNAINGVMQIFTKRGSGSARPQVTASLLSGLVQNNFSSAYTPQHDYSAQLTGTEGPQLSYNAGGSWNYMGPWSPAAQTSRLSVFGGGRLQRQTVTVDGSIRIATTSNDSHGRSDQKLGELSATGFNRPQYFSGAEVPERDKLNGQTFGMTVGYTPNGWWSNQLTVGVDKSDAETQIYQPQYENPRDSTLGLYLTDNARTSMQYTTTARLPIAAVARATITGGVDGWHNLGSYTSLSGTQLSGNVSTSSVWRRPGHNTGAFVQSQIGIHDMLFLTYGLRAEWNPNYGQDAEPNLAPRYGVAYTQELGPVTAKLRASYGRSTRPPLPGEQAGSQDTYAQNLTLFGPIYDILPNPDLKPETQQGGEGGVELYLGSRASVVITRYNQTVDNLIASPYVDSARSLQPVDPSVCCYNFGADGYAYLVQNMNLNLGSIRNEGWEVQGTANLGSFTTRGTYSWTKSRVIGVNLKYQSSFPLDQYPQYQPGASFSAMPEHTWALGTTYTRAATMIALNFTGVGTSSSIGSNNDFLEYFNGNIRLPNDRRRMALPVGYAFPSAGYTMLDINATQRISSNVDGVLQIQNAGNFYQNDRTAYYTVMGRQSKIGARIRF